MSGCGFQSRLNAFYDGELNPAEKARVAEHVAQCPACSALVEQMQRTSALLSDGRDDACADVAPDELARLHAAVDREMNRSRFQVDRSFWRAAAVLSGLAASVLVVTSDWLMETPVPQQTVMKPAAIQPEWATVAMTLRVDPLPYAGPQASPDQSALAEADARTDWMLENLKGREGR